MDCHHGSDFVGGNVIEFQSENVANNINENRGLGSAGRAVSATKDGTWNRETSVDPNSKSNHEANLFQIEVGSESPNKRARNSLLVDLVASNRSIAIGKMSHKTKLCCEFQVGTCPFTEHCNFANNVEELRELPPNWQEIVAAHKEEHPESLEPREVFQIPIVGFSDETKGPKMKHCRKYYTEEGCAYGENCIFIHDEHSKYRESAAICLVPGSGGGHGDNGSKSTLHLPNWKTRICKKWEQTGRCPYGSKCLYAHGSAELHCYGGGLVNELAKDSSGFDTKQVAAPAKASVGTVDARVPSVPYSYQIGVPSRKVIPNAIQKTGEIAVRRWKGPDKISKIYGDWIDDLE